MATTDAHVRAQVSERHELDHRHRDDRVSRLRRRRVLLHRLRRDAHGRRSSISSAGMLGIGMAYHRLLTHRSYKTTKWVEYFLTFCGTLALEGGPIFWVATHRIHHQKSDHEGDPHTPREGTLVGAHGLDHHRRGPAPRRLRAGALRARPLAATPFTSGSRTGTGPPTSSSASSCSPSAASRTCSGASSSARPSACTARGW